MGAIWFKSEEVSFHDRRQGEDSRFDFLKHRNDLSELSTSSNYMQSLDRLTWFTEQYDEASDEKFFSKNINLCDFEVKWLIGKGFYSKVFLVTKKGTNQPYAMKVIKKSELQNEEHKLKVLAEKKIMQICDSPFIVKLHYTFQTSK